MTQQASAAPADGTPTSGTQTPAVAAEPKAPEIPPSSDVIAPASAPVTVTVEKTGDPAADLALTYLAKAGVPQDSLAMQMARDGDFSLLRAEVAKKGAEGEAYVEVLEAAHARKAADAKAAKERAESVVVSEMGSQENWAAVKAFVAEKATPQELAEINASLKQGGMVTKATARYLRSVYEAGTGVSLGGKATASPAVPSGAREGARAATLALSPREYAAEVRKLAQEVGEGRVESDPRYQHLQARRRAYRA